jgi:hypothetical protein
MPSADFELNADGTVFDPQNRGWGGARPGAGRKGAGYEKPPELIELDKEKARHEKAKADLAELDYKVKSNQYVDRAIVRQVTATVFAGFVQTMRSVSDNLERAGIPPDVCVKVDAIINEALSDVGAELRMLGADD